MGMKIKLHTDHFDTNGKTFEISGFTKREGSTAITLDVVENAWTKRQMTVCEAEVEWLEVDINREDEEHE